MVLDPFTAIGLAGNIVQFVDFSSKLVADTLEVYHSTQGASATHSQLENITASLSELCNTVRSDSQFNGKNNPLEDLAENCQKDANELLYILETLKMKGGRRKWGSFRQALKGIWKESKIRALDNRLSGYRGELAIRLTLMFSGQHSRVLDIVTKLAENNKSMGIHRSEEVKEMLANVETVLANLRHLETEIKRKEIVQAVVMEAKPIDQLLGARCDDFDATANMGDILSVLRQFEKDTETTDPYRMQQVRDLVGKVEKIMFSQPNAETKPDLVDLHAKMTSLASTGRELLEEQNLLQNLRFKQIKSRHSNIPEAHARTFEWIFNDSVPDSTKPQAKFDQWLRQPKLSSEGMYWIGGKAGSGKSTLMKFICDDPRTKAALRQWAEPNSLVLASYFFWNWGSDLQKSQEGLLRTLLYDILRKFPFLIRTVLPNQPINENKDGWDRSELLDAFAVLKQHLTSSTNFCFFIDGLDEYHGHPRDLLEVLKDLSACEQVKICASSRPWPIFKQQFDANTDRRLYVQDLTRGDIDLYVRTKLEDDPAFTQAKKEDPRYQDLVVEIIERAEGVFLWVYLVVRSLLDGLTNADTMQTMQTRLRHLPSDLEDLFRHMLDSVDSIYRSQMARTFLVALLAKAPLPLLLYSILDELKEDPRFAARLQVLLQNAQQLDDFVFKREATMEKRLEARSKGLLELTCDVSTDRASWYLSKKVSFLHRTVGDFLRTEATRHRFVQLAGNTFNPAASICQAYLYIAKFLPLDGNRRAEDVSPLDELARNFMCYAREYERVTTISHTRTIDEFEQTLKMRSREKELYQSRSHKKRQTSLNNSQQHSFAADTGGAYSLFELSVQYGLVSYVRGRLERDPALARLPWQPPLLGQALIYSTENIKQHDPIPAAMISLLLHFNNDPNQKLQPKTGRNTIWQAYLGQLYWRRQDDEHWDRVNSEQFEILKALLESGADPNISIREKNSKEKDYVHIDEAIHAIFEEGPATKLMQIIHKKRSGKELVGSSANWRGFWK